MSKYKIIYMKADYEPWWQFEGWQDRIVSTDIYDNQETFEAALAEKLEIFREKYPNEKLKDEKYYAFWSDEEREYCVACEDDIQVYHGIIIEKDNE
ncbi:hypothetical protein UACE39S_06283 [Ureibacillus acetophenoni]